VWDFRPLVCKNPPKSLTWNPWSKVIFSKVIWRKLGWIQTLKSITKIVTKLLTKNLVLTHHTAKLCPLFKNFGTYTNHIFKLLFSIWGLIRPGRRSFELNTNFPILFCIKGFPYGDLVFVWRSNDQQIFGKNPKNSDPARRPDPVQKTRSSPWTRPQRQ